MGTPLGPKYVPYTYMDPLGVLSTRTFLVPLIGDIWSLIVGT